MTYTTRTNETSDGKAFSVEVHDEHGRFTYLTPRFVGPTDTRALEKAQADARGAV